MTGAGTPPIHTTKWTNAAPGESLDGPVPVAGFLSRGPSPTTRKVTACPGAIAGTPRPSIAGANSAMETFRAALDTPPLTTRTWTVCIPASSQGS